ncbi:uncharacterized protein LOC132941271 isoform X1 [Metopolophium dirhodum]|uniref:uncharacterized protein LOC132941271 isoform X1 n=2 Tax=Metopolophium dirhodum TaxID=44670 RepID=UPI00298F4077|nr:uncharacterized protein LOC132941271 isoform X1 [Metopolophium dirhodum]
MKPDNISIHLTIATFIFFVSWTAAIDIPNEDLNKSNKSITDDYETTLLLDDDDDDENINSTDYLTKPNTKMFNAGVTYRTETELICRKTFGYDGQTLSHCYNDSHCKLYGDCCRESQFYDEPGQTVAITGSVYNNSRYGCYNKHGLDSLQALLIGRCPRVTSVAERDKCERHDDDFISTYPVSSSDGTHTYKNVWCALCHGERRRVVYWKPLFVCYGRDSRVLPVQVRLENASDHTLLYRDGKWYYADYKNQTLFSCDYRIRPPDSIATPPLRPCVGEGSAGIVDGCPAGTPTAMALACASHTYTLFEYQSSGGRDRRVFRNADCARCNGLTVNQLMCEPPAPPLRMPFVGFGSLFAVSRTGERRNPCAPDEIYDVAAVKCRNVIQEELSGACLTFVTFGQGEYDGRTVSNGTAYVYAYKKRVRYRTGDRPTTAAKGAGSLLQVCTEDADGLLKPYEQSAYAVYLSYAGVVGSCVSATALVAHLVLFGCCTGAEPKNLPEKNLASLSTGLLVGYVGYLSVALQAVSPGNGLPCLVSALTMQFGFLAAFAWMFVMSADVWIVLHASTKKLRVAGGQRHGRFIVYSMFAWLAPAALTALSATIQLQLVPGALFPELRPNFHYDCWFRNPQSLVALFVLPAGTAIAANYVSFFGAVRLIATSDDGFKTSGSGGHCSNATTINRTRRNLKIYVRLSLMMGLAWVFALVGAFTDSDVAWTLNTALNSLQGAFIFVAFDCNRITVQKLAVFRKQPSVSETQTTTAATPLSAST